MNPRYLSIHRTKAVESIVNVWTSEQPALAPRRIARGCFRCFTGSASTHDKTFVCTSPLVPSGKSSSRSAAPTAYTNIPLQSMGERPVSGSELSDVSSDVEGMPLRSDD